MAGRGRRRIAAPAVGVVTCLAVMGAACSASSERADSAADDAHPAKVQPPSTPSSPPPPIDRLRPGEPCPVTRGVDPSTVPRLLDPEADGDVGWYGADDLWVRLPSARALGKFPTVTMEDGEFTDDYGRPAVRAIRLDGPGRADISFGGYATEVTRLPREPLQWWPTSVEVPAPGCWMVTVEFRSSTIRAVLRVRSLAYAPAG
jgi:hypothetical protein